MATSSITDNFVLNTPDQVNRFVEILEMPVLPKKKDKKKKRIRFTDDADLFKKIAEKSKKNA